MTPTSPDLRARVDDLMVADSARLGRRLRDLRRLPADERDAARATIADEVARAEAVVARRRALVPAPSYPPELPITDRHDDLLAALGEHQVVIVAGETGSGKSTQLPKLCLELGRGVRGLIGHTQPRRIAARSIAERVAEELGTEVGGLVGYTVRFTDQVGDDTLVKVMTDGILLAEVGRDRDLRRYDTIIIDEAHERSLNIDFLLGYLHRLLPRRPDLKVVITSATIDTERFARHFDDAPIIEVSGRTYPVEMRYRPVDDPDSADDRDLPQAIVDAVAELRREGPGDVLVFCSGEREIRDAADALRKQHLSDTEVLPLYARLSAAEQHRVFAAHRGRRIVLATNVAETSLTVPGIRYVVDPGTARISRYNHRTKVQRLPIEPVSQASADQRAGRCGRIGPGICIRLYDEDDLRSRPEFTEPEIQRTNLASVLLQMAALDLGEVESFPFVDPPDHRAVRDGIALLEELGAVDPDHVGTRRWLTPLGRQLARVPVDPRLGRMLVEADREGCLHELLVITAALSIQDPRERPTGQEEAARQSHARFAHPDSDFLTLLALWDHLRAERRARGSNQFRKMCRAEFLNANRVREWQDLHAQLRQITSQMGFRQNHQPADPDAVHRAILAGLLSHVGLRDDEKREYRGARNARFAVAPGSVLFKRSPRWVMAAELVETNRLWARMAAPVRPEWIEQVGAHLTKRTYGDPWWDRDRGTAMVHERVTVYGLPVVASRTVNLSSVDPAAARALLIRHALVEGDWDTHHRFVARNAQRVVEVHDLEARTRRDLLVGDDDLVACWDRRIPDHVVSVRHLDRWWNKRQRTDPHLLDLTLDELIDPGAGRIDVADYPDEWRQGALTLPVDYVFHPGGPDDGVVVNIPVAALHQVDDAGFDWNVPGLRAEIVTALVRSLPKPLRRALVPVPDTVSAVLERLDPSQGPLLDALADALSAVGRVTVRPADLDLDRVPDHLRPTFRVHDEHDRTLATGKDLTRLRAELRDRVRAALASAEPSIERSGLRDFDLDALPRVVTSHAPGHPVRAYPALVDEGDSVAVRLLATRDEQADAMWAGTRRLLRLRLPAAARALGRLPTREVRLALAVSPYLDEAEWLDDVLTCVLDHLVAEAGGPAWDRPAWDRLVDAVRDGLTDTVRDVWERAAAIMTSYGRISSGLVRLTAPATQEAVIDIGAQIDRLVYPGVLAGVGTERLDDLRRYLTAVERRIAKLGDDPARDQQRMRTVLRLEHEVDRAVARHPGSVAAEDLIWMLEELRVATFAQDLGTNGPVSEKRIRAALAALG
ncbi:MAG TPA: ATP-dependent RNA helicase HrpA [Acidimicrobiales bacterium]|nr:ATP-dependent RNA helicase HrpA [Acidimicrobiales bacterium]